MSSTTYKMALSADLKTVYWGRDTPGFPGGVIALPDFVYDDTAIAQLGQKIFHFVRDALYKRNASDGSAGGVFPYNMINMQFLSIVKYGAAVNADYLSAAAVTRAGAGTISPVVKYRTLVADINATAILTDFTWVSSDPTKATVNAATGVITYVAAGVTTITATEKNSPTPKTVSFVATLT